MIGTIIKSSLLGLALGAALAYAAELPRATPQPDPDAAPPPRLAIISPGKMTR